jgi:hypothetical protein
MSMLNVLFVYINFVPARQHEFRNAYNSVKSKNPAVVMKFNQTYLIITYEMQVCP